MGMIRSMSDPYTLITGDSISALRRMPDDSVHSVITSPPYFRLRSYDASTSWPDGQQCELGQEKTPAGYVDHLVEIFNEVHRVLRIDGSLWLNLADTYGDDKSLYGIPWLVATALRSNGWILRQDVIWSKAGGNCPRCMHRLERGSTKPESVVDRFVRAHEYMFLLTKSTDYFFDHEAVKEGPANRRDVLHLPSAMSMAGHTAVMPVDLAKIAVRGSTSEHGACADCGSPYTRVVERGAVMQDWQRSSGSSDSGLYTGEAQKDYATSGAENASDLKRRVLNSMRERKTIGWERTCICEETAVKPCVVLDPFSGAGTTGRAALELGRHYVGIEILERYNQIAATSLSRVNPAKNPDSFSVEVSGIYRGCAERLLERVPTESVSLLLTDPPYNVSRPNNFDTMGRTGINFEWDGEFDQVTWLELADRALKPGASVVIWNDWKVLGQVGQVLEDMGYAVKRLMVWVKPNPFPRNTGRSPVQAVETALWAVKPGASWTFNKRKDVPYETAIFDYAVPHTKKSTERHPCKKPDALFAQIIDLLSNPGDLVLDPFLGGGTTAWAAEHTGRRVIGFERDKKWFEVAKSHWSAGKERTA